MAIETHAQTGPVRRSPRVWASLLPAPLLGAAWLIGDLAKHRPAQYYLVDGAVFVACLLLTFGAYALTRRFARNAR